MMLELIKNRQRFHIQKVKRFMLEDQTLLRNDTQTMYLATTCDLHYISTAQCRSKRTISLLRNFLPQVEPDFPDHLRCYHSALLHRMTEN